MSVPKPKPTESTYTDHGDQFDEERCRRLEPTKEASSPNGIPSLTSPTSALSKVPLPKAAPGHGIETTPIVPKPTDLEQLIERNTECMHHHLKQIERLSMRLLMMLQPGHLV
ncbi:hypothetical protein BJV77DRAFT_87282 [Russula vinacea]|nr:hypothetical protein BJV77DRAFT_87282 [Russula vinacea]